MILSYIILSTLLISLISFVGALTLFLKEKLLDKILLFLVALSAGALMGGAFLHLIPESIEKAGMNLNLFLYLFLGFCIFFALEIFMSWHHTHKAKVVKEKPVAYLILISDSVHNFIDGLIIAASFVVDIHLGIITAIAVALHEIPQEIGDFGVLVYGGFKKTRALLWNFITAITVIIGGIAGLIFSTKIGNSIIFLLPFAAGNFIYIACSDLIPEIKHRKDLKNGLISFAVFLLGICLMFLLKFIAE